MSKKWIDRIFYLVVSLFVLLVVFIIYSRYKPYEKLGEYNDWTIYEYKYHSCVITDARITEDGIMATYLPGCDKYIVETSEGKFNFIDMILNQELTDEEIKGINDAINGNSN